MIIKSNKSASDLVPPGEYDGGLRQVTNKNENKKAVLHFATMHDEKEILVPREVLASLDSGPLLNDLEILNGAGFTAQQIEEGLDPVAFIGRKCRLIVIHKRTSGRKMI